MTNNTKESLWKNHYEVLGIHKNATITDIKKAFAMVATLTPHHPIYVIESERIPS
jgi:DnaJ-class molecular chaperone